MLQRFKKRSALFFQFVVFGFHSFQCICTVKIFLSVIICTLLQFIDFRTTGNALFGKGSQLRIALYIKTGKLTAQTLQKAMKAILSKGKKQLAKPPQGKQSLKQLMKQNAGVSNIEITEGNIKAFESTAKKYGIDFALKKDATESPPRYLVFFKGRDADVLTAAFKEFSAKKLTQEKKPSIRKLLSTLKEAAQGKNAERAKVKNKDREVSL